MAAPEHPDFAYQDMSDALVWDALRGIWITYGKGGPHFTFAAGAQAEVKGDANRLRRSPGDRGLVLGLMAIHPCVAWADAIAPVPNGMIEETEELAERTGKPMIRMYRPDDATSRYDMHFVSAEDEELAGSVQRITTLEDLTSTGSTPYYLARILRRVNPRVSVHTLSMLWRSPRGPQGDFLEGPQAPTYHTLSVAPQDVPLGYDEFVKAFGIIPDKVELGQE
jgi:hypothetical protein